MKKIPLYLTLFLLILTAPSFGQIILNPAIQNENSLTVYENYREGGVGPTYMSLMYPRPVFGDDAPPDAVPVNEEDRWIFDRDGRDDDDGGGWTRVRQFYQMIMEVDAQTSYDVKMFQSSMVLEYNTPDVKTGILIKITGDPQTGEFDKVSFNDSDIVLMEINRSDSPVLFSQFFTRLKSSLAAYKDVGDWDKDLVDNQRYWDQYYSELTPCMQSMVDLVRTLEFSENPPNPASIVQLFDQIYQAQLTFNTECPQ
jgi:hypothetical protein